MDDGHFGYITKIDPKKRWTAQGQNMRGRFQLPGFVPS
jgi:hypothetical protein